MGDLRGDSYAIELGRERSIWQIVGAAFALYRRYPILFLLLALAVVAPFELAWLGVTGTGELARGARGHASTGTEFVLELVDLALVGPLISALHVHAVVLVGEGARPRLGEVGMRGLRVLPVVAATEIVAAIGIGLGFILLVIPGVIVSIRWAVAAQAAAIEEEGWSPALRRSGVLAGGHYWRILGLLVITTLFTLAASVVGKVALGSDATTALVVIVGIVVRTITASFGALALALLYFDLVARRDGLPRTASPPEYPHLRDLD